MCVYLCICNNVWDILEGTDQRSFVVSIILGAFCQVPSSPFLKMSYFTSKDETPTTDKLERKSCNILHQREDDVY